MKTEKHDAVVNLSATEKDIRQRWMDYFKSSPVPDEEILDNLGLFLGSKNLARILFFYEIYRKVVGTHGIIIEFGVRWGQTLSLLAALRGIFEPFNRHRKIVGFDTFQGLKGVTTADGVLSGCSEGSYSVSENYEGYLEKIMAMQEQLNPLSHIKKYEIIKGDAVETVPHYFQRHPETIVSLAVLDFDLYKPTKTALEQIKTRLIKGSVLVFDELCDEIFPGETVALMETMGLNRLRIQRLSMTSRVSFVEIE